ncbi:MULTISPECIES: ABC transporter ATP-binding protein [Moorena]|uniref:ABC-type polysaccharide/polyol phosphate transport system, ATPase component n=1 Tax=Moorena producens 3L TaxID=489825 RepID=F4XK54_9CYAN|nr:MULTISPECIES: ABC transporter ATP-binding protein [Moorena]EGJ35013.1 ABC-type polysaccharide/polyol phosphate transport system, ATPase component [Moorena producens 3L]NEP33708.1 ABC transporter ATP-binding protein [Moorena sp. SIO3B2]NEP67588.1 ABC transporter ATP-binding protein [Moorena sp. SIO3A5]NER86912.1 ABC transporter ATP-binding protein [Moorena sp. SIO3A2]OLT65336.1 ABC transporter ATP-binding protein [Moorena producens 3L]
MISSTERDVADKSQDSEVILSVNGVSKKFCRDLKRSLLYGVHDIATELVGLRQKDEKLRKKEFWALNDVSIQLRRGEAIGLVGTNGSGKSTLLRIISGLIKPDVGSVEVKGRLAPLIALGAGFNPILTGRENIYANMSILGLSKEEIDQRFDQVLEFAEIGDAIDSPVQTYSSGMAARLGFASAIHTEPDILLIDEVLAVGDLLFRMKCYRKLSELRDKGTTFVLVAHNPNSILSICDSAIYLQRGKLLAVGKAAVVMQKYDEDLFLDNKQESQGAVFLKEKSPEESTGLDIIGVYFRDGQGNRIEYPMSGQPLYLCVKCKAHTEISHGILCFQIREIAGEGEPLLNLDSHLDNTILKIYNGLVELQLEMPYLGLRPGSYSSRVWVKKPPKYIYDHVPLTFKVKSNSLMTQCQFYQPRKWKALPQ